jgi:hypothetical protein
MKKRYWFAPLKSVWKSLLRPEIWRHTCELTLVKDHSSALSAIKSLSPKAICKLMSWPIPAKNLLSVKFMGAIKDTQELGVSRSTWDYTQARDPSFALKRGVKKHSGKKEIYLHTLEFIMARNLSSVTLQTVRGALPPSICFKITKRSIRQKDHTSVAIATKSSWGLLL